MILSLDSYKLLGKSGLRVSPIGIGTQWWSNGADQKESRAIFDYYVDLGGNFFDTSNIYNQGASESYLGEFIKEKRRRLVISTKYSMNDDNLNPNAGGNHRKNMIESLEVSLKRLQTDYVDLFWIHAWDFRTPIEEVMKAFDDLVRQGKVLHIGICNVPAWKIAEANTLAALRGWTSFVGIQIQYNILERNAERDILPFAREHQVSVLPWSPLAGGILAGAYNDNAKKIIPGKSPMLNSRSLAVGKKVALLGTEIGKSASQVSLNWVLQKPGVTMPLIGPNSVDQLKENLGCLDFALSEAQMAKLDALNPLDLGNAHYFRKDQVFKSVIDGNMEIERPYQEFEPIAPAASLSSGPRRKFWSEDDLSFSGKIIYRGKNMLRSILRAVNPSFENRITDARFIKRLNRDASDLIWQPIERCPVTRLDSAAIQIKDKLYVLGGYETVDHVLSQVDVLDLNYGTWSKLCDMPNNAAQSHAGVAKENDRYIYLISGQVGSQAYPAVRDCFVFDTETLSWNELPPLPQERYAPTAQLWRGRIHVIGGAKSDRYSSAVEHWSIAVKDGKAVEKEWREEKSIPVGGMHRASAVIHDQLYVFGGQVGDWVAQPDDPFYMAIPPEKPETTFKEVFMLEEAGGDWQRKTDMLNGASQTEFSTVYFNGGLAILGGMKDKDPRTNTIEMSSDIQVYDAKSDSWRKVGTLPYCVKSGVAGYHNGELYYATGQKERGSDNPAPGQFVSLAWKAKFSI